MKFQIVSDLHMEWFPDGDTKQTFLIELLDHNEANYVILAGDCGTYEDYLLINSILKSYGKKAYFVFGNHEYYGKYIEDNGIKTEFLSNMMHLNISMIDNIAGGTMWTQFPDAEYDPGRYVNDTWQIKGLTPTMWAYLYSEFVNALAYKWVNPSPEIMVTHHAPSFKSVPKRFEGSDANYCFANNIDDFLDGSIKLWVHGHTHDSFDYIINGTRVVCNPFGYYKKEENTDFDYRKIVEV